MGRVAWIIQVGPMESHEFLEAENFFCWGQKRNVKMEGSQKDASLLALTMEERSMSQGLWAASRSRKRQIPAKSL